MERQDALLREDYARQRNAVAGCVREILEAAFLSDAKAREITKRIHGDRSETAESSEIVAVRERCYQRCFLAVRNLELEITHPAVVAATKHLTSSFGGTMQFHAREVEKGIVDYATMIRKSSALPRPMMEDLNDLIDVARMNLHVPIGNHSK